MALTTTPEALQELGRLHARILELERLCGIRAPGPSDAAAPPPAYAEGLHEIVAGFAEEMVVVCDIGGQVLHVNAASERVLGYRPQEMIGTNAWSYVHPEDLKATAAARSAPLDDGIPFENRALAADGSYRWLEFIARRWPNENPTHVVLRFRRAMHRETSPETDLAFGTSKLHVQLRYAASLARLSQLALGLPLVSDVLDAATSLGASALEAQAGVWLEPDGAGLRVQAETGLGSDRRGLTVPIAGSLAGLAWTRRVPADETQLPREERAKDPVLAAAGAACGLAFPVRGVDRVHGVLLVACTVPRAFDPEDVHFAETLANIVATALDSRAAQEALSRRERLTRAVFDHSRDGILIVDDDGRCVDANQAAHAALGVAPGALDGRRLAEVAVTSVDLASDGRTTVATGEVTLETDAGPRTLELERVPRIQPGLSLVILRDVTEHRELAARLARSEGGVHRPPAPGTGGAST
jgi:PAS domain S-box-containing protein